jgi:hypothetical protein
MQNDHTPCPSSSDPEGANMLRNSDKERMNVRLQNIEAPDRIVKGLSQSG